MSQNITTKTADLVQGRLEPDDQLQLKIRKITENGLSQANNDVEESYAPDVKVSNIIGDFGPYQIAVVIFAALRAMTCAMDGLSGPFLSPNIKNFQCDACDISSRPSTFNSSGVICRIYDNVKTRYDLDASQCFFDNPDSLRPDRINCKSWNFNFAGNERFMSTLTVEQSLVCDREWLKSLSNSLYFVGATLGLLFWGVISDKYGRKTAYVCSHLVTLTFGFWALFADSMSSYIILRAINSFGMIGELIPRSIQLEVVATEYRFICSVVCQIGWATGIILVPALSYLNPSYRFILSIPIGVSFAMLPWLYYLPESARWLITNKQYAKARDELRRAAKINGKLTDDIDLKIERYNRQVLREEVNTAGSKRVGIWRCIIAIFTNFHILKDTISVFTLLFVAEVVYFSLTLNVADLGGSLYINYIISGLSELVSIAICGFLLAYLSRRMCLALLLLASTVSYLLLSLTDVYQDYLSMTLILAVNAFGKLTAIGNLMVIILVSQEIFPTVIRQFGTSLCITIGKAGSAVAPFTHELGQMIGQSWCFAMFSLVCLSCAVIPFILSETGDRELPDTVVDVEEGGNNARRGRRESAYLRSDSKNGGDDGVKGSLTSLKHESDLNNKQICLRKSNGFGSFENHIERQSAEEDLNNNNNVSSFYDHDLKNNSSQNQASHNQKD